VVERIEILSGGASAAYGSDAIAGVVNIILKKQAEGVDVNLKGHAQALWRRRRGQHPDRERQLHHQGELFEDADPGIAPVRRRSAHRRLHDLGNADWRDKLNASLSWKAGDWTNTLFLQRYGKIPNGSGEAWLSPTTLVYRLNHHFGS